VLDLEPADDVDRVALNERQGDADSLGQSSDASMTSTQPTPALVQHKAPSHAAGWLARLKARLAVAKVARGRFTRHNAEFNVRSGEFSLGFWLRERDHFRLHKLVVGNALYFEFQIEKDVPFARLSGTTFHSSKLIFYFGKIMRITVGISELNVSCRRTDETRSDWQVKRWALPFKSKPPVPTI
jgi:hypothetical protein